MPTNAPRIGVQRIGITSNAGITVPSLQTLTFTACAITPTVVTYNDADNPLSSSDTYQVVLALLGMDLVNKGYTVARSSPSSGNLVVTTGQVIEVQVPVANWPANYQYAAGVAVFIKVNSADFQLADIGYIDTNQTTFSFIIKTKPLTSKETVALSVLQSTTVSNYLGSRVPDGITESLFDETSGGVTIERARKAATISPDHTDDYPAGTTSSATIRFSLLVNEMLNIISAQTGNYVTYTSGGKTYKQGHMSLATAVANFVGNRRIKLFMPRSADGTQEIVLYYGNLTTNQEGGTETWSRDNPTTLPYVFVAATQDRLLADTHTEVRYQVSA